MNNVIIRCNASYSIGSGHVIRCLALASSLYGRGYNCCFLTNQGGKEVIELFSTIPIQFIEFNEHMTEYENAQNVIKNTSAQFFICDSYDITAEDVQDISTIIPLMVVDDNYSFDYYNCDAILNHNIYADEKKYRRSKLTNLLCGPQYTLLRRDFLKYSNRKKSISQIAENVLITFGGGDEQNYTQYTLHLLKNYRMPLNLSIVLGTHYPFDQQLRQWIVNQNTFHRYNVLNNVANMAEVMWEQDLVICSGGSTLNELALLGVPSLCFVTADNQLELANKAQSEGFTKILIGGFYQSDIQSDTIFSLIDDPSLRDCMSKAGRSLIDGMGANRVADYIHNRINYNSEDKQ